MRRGFLAGAFLAFAVAAGVPANACINTYRSEIRSMLARHDKVAALTELARLEATQRRSPTFENTNDFAASLILFGRHVEAVAILTKSEARYPGRAITAANLGTAYELSGDNAQALRWIREGVTRDPREHQGTEWLHVKILEAKIALQRNPAWLDSHTVLGISFGTADAPAAQSLPADHLGKRRSFADTIRAIDYQLKERTFFVKPPDAIVAELYKAWADMALSTGSRNRDEFVDGPRELYQSALRYGHPDRALIERRLKRL